MTSRLAPIAPFAASAAADAPDAVSTAAAIAPRGAYALLDQFGILDATGPDAADFLHKQLTNEVAHLGPDAAALGGLCSPKGRLIASFLYWRETVAAQPDAPAGSERVRLVLAADIREAIQKRLSMFVLRAKVALGDATPTLALLGLTARTDDAAALLSTLGAHFGTVPETVRERREGAVGTLIRLPDAAGYLRFLWALPRPACDALRPALDETLAPMSAAHWDWLDVQSGEPRITAATQDRFVPQMVNFEAIGGVNFRKGCYPGQEIVARSQYRGTVKRRATLGHAAAAQAGDEVFDAGDPLQPCGHVVNAAPAPGGGVDCLVELKLSLLADASVHVGSVAGPRLTVRGLPYALPDLSA
ncbi:folate-binding protein [Robbsia sp. Bb-Pol-6]|uniref:Folate-binding protein n=1 Tax=Robbsia betulipollinis TaxID=2981849 RepID=A0ABT3ZNJ2_9BURK|nr:folate-binding protein [Robbsia betulipollinis]MCY0388118.1 folate-binding protein [Robbsia betulipollinis]